MFEHARVVRVGDLDVTRRIGRDADGFIERRGAGRSIGRRQAQGQSTNMGTKAAREALPWFRDALSYSNAR
jgi:hypothetical protein